jgi:tRNA uridine 5-carbamoylmethylation protein Kti12
MQELVIIRGLPGSGKSTLARELTNKLVYGERSIHLESDMYFMRDNEYKFEAERLHSAHQWCFDRVKVLLKLEWKVVVSNTFTTIKELKPYFELSKELGIVPRIIICNNNYGSIHNVPEETLGKMKNRFQYDISSLFDYLKVTEVPNEACM